MLKVRLDAFEQLLADVEMGGGNGAVTALLVVTVCA
jgi:hypothetical protein